MTPDEQIRESFRAIEADDTAGIIVTIILIAAALVVGIMIGRAL